MSAIYLPEEMREFMEQSGPQIDEIVDKLGDVLSGKPLGAGLLAAQLMIVTLFSRIPEEDRKYGIHEFIKVLLMNMENDTFKDDVVRVQ